MQVVAEHRFRTLHQAAFAFEEIRIQRGVAVHRVLQQRRGTARLAHLRFHPLPAYHADRVAAQVVAAARAAGGGRIAAAGFDQLVHLPLQRWGQFEIGRIAHHLREVHGGAKLVLVAEADRHHAAIDHRGGGGVAGAEIDAESHVAAGPGRGPRTVRQAAAWRKPAGAVAASACVAALCHRRCGYGRYPPKMHQARDCGPGAVAAGMRAITAPRPRGPGPFPVRWPRARRPLPPRNAAPARPADGCRRWSPARGRPRPP